MKTTLTYTIWETYSVSSRTDAILTRYYVVNQATKQVQSSWKDRMDAIRTRDSLNRAKAVQTTLNAE